MRVTNQVYLECVTDYSCKDFTIALLDNGDGTWSVARNHGAIGAPTGWSLHPKARSVSQAAAEKVFDSLRREKDRHGYVEESRIPAYLRYTGK